MLKTCFFRASVAVVASVCLSPAVSAQTITSGFTFSVASAGGNTATGTHYHSSTGGDFGNPAGKAEVGRYSSEEVRGLSEYNLTGLSAASSAYVTFDIYKEGGLFSGVNDTPFTGNIAVLAYQGNNAENISDYQAPSVSAVGSFLINPVTNNVGDVFSFDITSIFNFAIANSWSSLGIRLQADPQVQTSQAWTFQDFRLTSDNQSTNPVPEPATWAMMIAGFGAIGGAMRRRARVSVRYC